MTKVSVQTFARGCKKLTQLAKTLRNITKFLDVIIFHTNFKDDVLINCTGKLRYRYGNFQNIEEATEGFIKNFTKFILNVFKGCF